MSRTDLALAIAIWVAALGGLGLVVFGLVGAGLTGSPLLDAPFLPGGLALWTLGGLLIWRRSKGGARDE